MDPNPVYYLGDRDVYDLENRDPEFRVNFTGRHSWSNGVSATVRGNWYGDYMLSSLALDEFQKMRGAAYWDLDLTWDINDALSATFGGNNVFDAAPDTAPDFLICCGFTNDVSSVIDWQGPYYYLRGAFNGN